MMCTDTSICPFWPDPEHTHAHNAQKACIDQLERSLHYPTPNSTPQHLTYDISTAVCGFKGCRLTFVPTVNYKRLALPRSKMSHEHFGRRLKL